MIDYKNFKEKSELIAAKKLSLVDNLKSFHKKIEDQKRLNAFNFVFEDSIEHAEIIEKKIHSGTAGKLAGCVAAIKDVLALKDKPLSCSSKILDGFNSLYTATAVQRLIDEDAIIIGKTNCDEFAMGSSNENSAFGNVLNPIDEERVPGGSSGGSAAAVAAGLCDVSLGTDTGGSIRQPAAFCGVYGLKPTYGRVSRFGLNAFASSFDTIGPFTTNVDDAIKIMEVISGHDSNDSTSAEIENFHISDKPLEPDKIKIGIPTEYFAKGLSSEIKNKIESLLNEIEKLGCDIKEVHLPHTQYAIATYYILTTAEASSNLERFDGARYGYRDEKSNSLEDMYSNSRTVGFGSEVKRRIMLGTYVLSAGYYDAYYKKAQQVRRLFKKDFDDVFHSVDFLITPTTPTTAFRIGENINDPLQMYLNDIYTTTANLAGIPGLNIPIGFDSNKLPIGMQVMSSHFNEAKLLSFAKIVEGTIDAN